MDIKFIGSNFALLADLRHPYLALGDNEEWRPQFVKAISSSKVHHVLEQKLARLAPFILCYTKIEPDPVEVIKLTGFASPTLCIVSSVGEHAITPWMIIHNIAHTYLSWHLEVKRGIIKLLKLDPVHYSITARQSELVKCAAARLGRILNLNELIYELFTTWVWWGETKSGVPELAAFCDEHFSRITQQRHGTVFWHRFRPPTGSVAVEVPWLQQLLGS